MGHIGNSGGGGSSIQDPAMQWGVTQFPRKICGIEPAILTEAQQKYGNEGLDEIMRALAPTSPVSRSGIVAEGMAAYGANFPQILQEAVSITGGHGSNPEVYRIDNRTIYVRVFRPQAQENVVPSVSVLDLASGQKYGVTVLARPGN